MELAKRLIVRPEQMLDEMCAALGGRADLWKSSKRERELVSCTKF